MEISLAPPAVTLTSSTAEFSTTNKLLKPALSASNYSPVRRSKKESIICSRFSTLNPSPNSNKLFPSSSSSSFSPSSSLCTLYSSTRTGATSSSSRTGATSSSSSSAQFALTPPTSSTITSHNRHWMVIMETPPQGIDSKSQIIDYYVKTLQSVLGSEEEAQMCIYDASWGTRFGFCCDIEESTSLELARLPSVISVRPDPDYNSSEKDYSSGVHSSPLLNKLTGSTPLFSVGNAKHWVVRIEKPDTGVISKVAMVDYCTEVLTKVIGNHKDAQMCMYHVSWQSDFGFCCELDEECARELAGLPGVLSVQPEENVESTDKDYRDENRHQFDNSSVPSATNKTMSIRTKKLFVTGLSFYTSEKTLRAAFEDFGELVEVKIIMDKISKRSKGYAFVEYTTEEAAGAALKEMNGKIINGWMITVDVAKSNPPKYSRGRPRPAI